MKNYFFTFLFILSFFLHNICCSRVLTVPPKKQASVQHVEVKSAYDHIFKDIEALCNLTFSPDMKRYYSEIDHVDGWFDKRLIIVLRCIDDFQEKNNIHGNLGEIGVWQGRSFIPLMHLAKKDELVAAIDCFESYEFNRDNSGGLCKTDNFTNNLTRYCSNLNTLKIIKGDSSLFSPDTYLSSMGNDKGFRIFSIDGCHEAYTTTIDMENVYRTLVDGGVLIIDDYFHWCWPGVSEGVNTFMQKNSNALKPFFVGMNKIFFARPEYAKKYFDTVKKVFLPQDLVIKKFFDVDTVIYDPHN